MTRVWVALSRFSTRLFLTGGQVILRDYSVDIGIHRGVPQSPRLHSFDAFQSPFAAAALGSSLDGVTRHQRWVSAGEDTCHFAVWVTKNRRSCRSHKYHHERTIIAVVIQFHGNQIARAEGGRNEDCARFR